MVPPESISPRTHQGISVRWADANRSSFFPPHPDSSSWRMRTTRPTGGRSKGKTLLRCGVHADPVDAMYTNLLNNNLLKLRANPSLLGRLVCSRVQAIIRHVHRHTHVHVPASEAKGRRRVSRGVQSMDARQSPQRATLTIANGRASRAWETPQALGRTRRPRRGSAGPP